MFLNLKFSAIGLEFIFAKHVMSLGFSEQLPLSWHFSLLFCTKCCLILGQFSIFTFSGTCRKKCLPQCFVAVPTSFFRLNTYSLNLIAKLLSARFEFINSVRKLCKLILFKILTYLLTFNMTRIIRFVGIIIVRNFLNWFMISISTKMIRLIIHLICKVYFNDKS